LAGDPKRDQGRGGDVVDRPEERVVDDRSVLGHWLARTLRGKAWLLLGF
jgi:hypothetical protein